MCFEWANGWPGNMAAISQNVFAFFVLRKTNRILMQKQLSPKFVNGIIDNKSALVQAMAQSRTHTSVHRGTYDADRFHRWIPLTKASLIIMAQCTRCHFDSSRPRVNIKWSSYQYMKSHCGDKTIIRSSYLHNGISYTGKTTSLYWIRFRNENIPG